VELFLNGKSQGIRKKEATQKYGRYRLTWDSIRYEPGEIKVIAYDKKEKVAMTAIKRTAGTPYQIKLIADRSSLHATGNDLSFVTVQVLDKDGNLCPLASDNIQFQIKGAGLVRGVANGDPTNIQSLAGSEMQAFHGQCVVVIQSGEKPGSVTLTASSPELKSATLYLNVN
jgi:beta-galactosidase